MCLRIIDESIYYFSLFSHSSYRNRRLCYLVQSEGTFSKASTKSLIPNWKASGIVNGPHEGRATGLPESPTTALTSKTEAVGVMVQIRVLSKQYCRDHRRP